MLRKATKEQAKLRLSIYGLSGGGKTYSGLAIAEGLVKVFGGKIAVLDTEFRSASKYANTFDFVTDDFGEPTIANYIAFINMCKEDPDITVLLIDSLTHAWQWCLGEVDRLTRGSSKSDSRSAWKVVSPQYDSLVNAILTAPFHVIGTMRAKTEWSTTNDSSSKSTRRDTLAPVQREGFEFEFDMLMEMNQNHFGTIIKDRSGKFQDMVIEKPGIDFGKKLAEWLKDGVPVTPPQKSLHQRCVDGMNELKNIMLAKGNGDKQFFTDDEYSRVKETINGLIGRTDDECWAVISELLDAYKRRLHELLDGDAVPVETTTTASTIADQSNMPRHEQGGIVPNKQSVKDEFRKQVEKNSKGKVGDALAVAAGEANTPSMFTEPEAQAADEDNFVDDNPFEDPQGELVAAGAGNELEIF